MARFEYKARNKSGIEVQGLVDGVSEAVVATELLRSGIIPITISPYVEKQTALSKLKLILRLDMPSTEDLTFLSRQMHSLIKAGVPLVKAVNVVLDGSKNPQLRSALADILTALGSGQALASAMRRHPLIFPTLMTALVNVGENTGSLDQIFSQVAVHLEREMSTRKQIAMAIRYPITVLIVIAIAITVINILVIPAFSQFFTQFRVALPLPTRILIAVSNFFVHDWYILVAGIIGTIAGLITYVRAPMGRMAWDKWKLSIPLIGDILNRALLGRFARNFALSVRTGVPLLEAITMIAKTTDNTYVSEQILTMRTSITHGESLTIAATRCGMFTSLVLQMLSIGEETGEMDKLLDEVADYYEKEVDYNVKRLGDAIEPILIIGIAGIVLLLALGIFLPMWDLWKVTLVK
jgi:MSHA biogenesis protein MshG